LSALPDEELMAELTAAPGVMQVVTPAPRPLWRRLFDADTDALADHGPEWIDAMCDDGRYVDASRLYELPDGRRFVLPLTRRRGMAGVGGWLACHPPAWGIGGLVGPGADAGVVTAVLAELCWLLQPGRGFGRIRCMVRIGRLLTASLAQWSCHAGPMSST
jgi:hypothetical protein